MPAPTSISRPAFYRPIAPSGRIEPLRRPDPARLPNAEWSALRGPVRDLLLEQPFAGRAFIERVRVHAPRIGLGVLVCIPACNEEERLLRTLEALAVSLNHLDEPAGILVLANNCADDTAERAWNWAGKQGLPVAVCEARLASPIADAGHARRLALDLGVLVSRFNAVLLTTDADTRVSRDWARRLVAPIRAGAGASAGMIDVEVEEFAALPSRVHAIERDERALFREHARMWRLLLPDEPVSLSLRVGGASLAVGREAYRRVGGMPALTSCEDRAMVARMLRHDEAVVFDLHATIRTSCRLDARAGGGMAGMLSRRIAEADPLCDEELRTATGHALACLTWQWLRGAGDDDPAALAAALRIEPTLLAGLRDRPHGEAWCALEKALPPRERLRASDVARQVRRARLLRKRLAHEGGARAPWRTLLRTVMDEAIEGMEPATGGE